MEIIKQFHVTLLLPPRAIKCTKKMKTCRGIKCNFSQTDLLLILRRSQADRMRLRAKGAATVVDRKVLEPSSSMYAKRSIPPRSTRG